MAKALVTGGAGFIGSQVTREPLDLGHEGVRRMASVPYKQPEIARNLPPSWAG